MSGPHIERHQEIALFRHGVIAEPGHRIDLLSSSGPGSCGSELDEPSVTMSDGPTESVYECREQTNE